MYGQSFIIRNPYTEKYQQAEYSSHLKRLEKIHNQNIDRKLKKQKFDFLIANQLSKNRMMKERKMDSIYPIERRNKKLVEKLNALKKNNAQMFSQIESKNEKSLILHYQQRKQTQIDRQNFQFAQRIIRAKPIIQKRFHDEFYNHQYSFSQQIKKFHKKRDLPPLELFLEQQQQKSIQKTQNIQTEMSDKGSQRNQEILKETVEDSKENLENVGKPQITL